MLIGHMRVHVYVFDQILALQARFVPADDPQQVHSKVYLALLHTSSTARSNSIFLRLCFVLSSYLSQHNPVVMYSHMTDLTKLGIKFWRTHAI